MGCEKNCPKITETAAKQGQDLDQSSMNLLKKSQNNQIFPLTDNPCTSSLLTLKEAEPELTCPMSFSKLQPVPETHFKNILSLI